MGLKREAASLVRDLKDFVPELSSLDRVWRLLFPDRVGKWHHLHVTHYQATFYVTDMDHHDAALEIESGAGVRLATGLGAGSAYPLDDAAPAAMRWEPLLAAARAWLKVVHHDWVKANRRVRQDYPLNRRFGIIPNALVRALVPDIYRLDMELGKARSRKVIQLVEAGFFNRPANTERATMTAADYFEYCRIAYLAARRKGEVVDASLSGRDMYARYADGRHEGLLDIEPESAQAFAEWLDGTHPKRTGGGHPWEIKRGGNTTHINLAVMRPSPYRKEGFKVELRGEAIGRMVETLRMLLAIHAASLPIAIANPEGVRQRLLGQDNIGIVPAGDSLHRANQHFPREQTVFDVMYYADLGRNRQHLTPFITWEPLPTLRPRE